MSAEPDRAAPSEPAAPRTPIVTRRRALLAALGLGVGGPAAYRGWLWSRRSPMTPVAAPQIVISEGWILDADDGGAR